MKTTYYIEGKSDKHVYGHYTSLSQAKYDLIKMFKNNMAQIVCLKGPYKHEGFHAYRLEFDGNKFRKVGSK